MNFSDFARSLVTGALVLLVLGSFTAPAAVAQPSSVLPAPSVGGMAAPKKPAPLPLNALPAPQGQMPSVEFVQDENYRLGSGDKLKVIVYGEEDLGGEYFVAGNGEVQLPLLGQMRASGLTIHDFQAAIAAKFVSEGYLNNPRVSVEVQNYRPFYIIGEVKTPGQYPYVSGMNILNAVALAGGYTYRADDKTVYVRRNGSTNETRMKADQTTVINPGDIIRIDERIF